MTCSGEALGLSDGASDAGGARSDVLISAGLIMKKNRPASLGKMCILGKKEKNMRPETGRKLILSRERQRTAIRRYVHGNEVS